MLTKQQTRQRLTQAAKLIDCWLDYRVYISEIPGLAFGLVHEDGTIFKNTYGYADLAKKIAVTSQTCFRIASISKIFTAIAIMQLAEQDKLQLDDKVSKHLKWFRSRKDHNTEKITIRQLLSHSSGLTRDGYTSHWESDRFPTPKEIQKQIADGASIFKPVERFKYSNFGYAILGEIIFKVSGKTYAQYIQENILDRLQLHHTSVELTERTKKLLARGYSKKLPRGKRNIFPQTSTQALAPAAGLISNLDDLCVFLSAQLPGNMTLLTDTSKREIQRIQWVREGKTIHYGLGYEIWKDQSKQLYGHGGGFPGYLTYVRMDAKYKVGIVLLSNAIDSNIWLLMDGAYKAIHYLLEQLETSKQERRVPNLRKYEGTFSGRWGETTTIGLNNRLYAYSPGYFDPIEDFASLEYLGRNQFRITECDDSDSIGETLRFDFNKQGKVNTIYWGANPMKPFRKN